MGRKSIGKTRKPLTAKMDSWLDELIPALADQNLSQLTIDDIAALTKKSKSTIYEYFEAKNDIIYAAVQRRVSKIDHLPNAAEGESVFAVYHSLIDWLVTHVDDISFSFLNQLENNFNDSWELIVGFMQKLLNTLKALYARGIEEKVFRPVSLEILMAMDEFFILKSLSQSNKNQTIDHLVVAYVDIRLNGILA